MAIDRNNLESLIHTAWLGQHIVCFWGMWDDCYHKFRFLAFGWPRSLVYIFKLNSVPGLPASDITHLTLICLGIPYVLFESLLISANVIAGGTVHILALLCNGPASNCFQYFKIEIEIVTATAIVSLCTALFTGTVIVEYCTMYPTLRHLLYFWISFQSLCYFYGDLSSEWVQSPSQPVVLYVYWNFWVYYENAMLLFVYIFASTSIPFSCNQLLTVNMLCGLSSS